MKKPFPTKSFTKKEDPNRARINEEIRSSEIRLIDENGEQRGIVSPAEAMEIAKVAELDLVEVAPQSKPPVCRIMDYSKFKYDQAKKEKEARKKQKIIHIKEVKFKPRIDPHDYEYKKQNMERFLKRGDKVKVTMVFRGREKFNMNAGEELLKRLAEDLAPIATVESEPAKDRGQMVMVMVGKN